MTLLIVYLLLALGISFLCSILEAVILSVPPTYIEAKIHQGNKTAVRLKNIKRNISKPLAAILALNTIAHTIGAAGVGAQATMIFGEVYFGIISAILTLLILVISEIIPKTLGASHAKSLSLPSVHILSAIMVLMYPLVVLSGFISRVIVPARKRAHTVSRDELAALANIGRQEGTLDADESKIIDNLLKLKKINASAIMTPRPVLASAPADMTVEEFTKEFEKVPYTRIPIWDKDPEHITGYVLKPEVLEKMAQDEHHKKISTLKRDILIAYEGEKVTRLYRRMLTAREHITLLVDEYGSTAGVITLEDIIETMTGTEIMDETDTHQDLQALARSLWKKKSRS